jgi:hypothetical protein
MILLMILLIILLVILLVILPEPGEGRCGLT